MRESWLDKCIKKTAHMDLSTSELAKEQAAWLAKEIRGVRKKLNQVAKLQESEERSIVLSTEQRAKVDRRSVLEAELCVYESALEEVEKRIKELSLEEREQRRNSNFPENYHRTKRPKEQSESPGLKPSKDGEKGVENKEFLEAEESSLPQKKAEKSFTCDICSIKCPDETSFELHKNGRKHRNRVTQVTEEEKKKAAASIMEQHQLEQVKTATVATPPSVKKAKNAWGVPSIQPKYKLPPPPYPAVTQVTPGSAKRNAQKTDSSTVSTATPRTLITSPAAKFRKKLREEAAKVKSPKEKPTTQSPGCPVWASPPPGSTRCVPLSLYAAPDLTPPPSAVDGAHRNSYSLADFLAPKPTPSPKVKVVAPWSSRQSSAPANSKSLAQIQAEEVDFKMRQDKSYEQGGGNWFIERKERADSLREIELSAEKEREERLLIEEQLRIEAQIRKDLALQREKEKKQEGVAKKRSSRRKNKIGPNGSAKGTPTNKEKPQDGDKKVGIAGNSKPSGCRPKNGNRSKAGKSGPKVVPSNQKGENVPKKGRPGNTGGSSGRKQEPKQGVPPASKLHKPKSV
jgi:hypothetical protein